MCILEGTDVLEIRWLEVSSEQKMYGDHGNLLERVAKMQNAHWNNH